MANSTRLSEFINGNSTVIPPELKAFINETALMAFRKKNETEDWIIRDEDVEGDDFPDFNSAHFDGEKTVINVSPEAGQQLFQHWVDQAVSGLMAAVATTKLEILGDEHKNEHHNCTKKAVTVPAHAKCVLKLLDATSIIKTENSTERLVTEKPPLTSSTSFTSTVVLQNTTVIPGHKKYTSKRYIKRNRLHYKKKATQEQHWIGSFRFKRNVPALERRTIKNMKQYKLKTPKKPTLLGEVANKLTKTIRAFKDKTGDDFSWQSTMDEIMLEAKRLQKIEKVKKMFEKRLSSFGQIAKDMGIETNPGLKAFDFVMNEEDEPLVKSKEQQIAAAKEKEKNLTLDEQIMRAPIQLVREGVKLGMALSGKDVSNFDSKTLKMISPRIMSLVPEEDEEKDTVSLPSLKKLSKLSEKEQLSLPSLTKTFDENGHQEMLNFVFEASGVSDAAKYMKVLSQAKEREQFMDRLKSDSVEKKKSTFTRDEIVNYVGPEERKKMEWLEKLHHMFTEDQIGKLNKTGYFGMTDEQLEFIYGPDSPYNNTNSLKMYKNITENRLQEAVENTIRKLASEEMSYKLKRQKDIVLEFFIYQALIEVPEIASQPIILTPIILSTLILSPAVFGVVVLSPWVFVPLILSPRLLGPIILNPFAFVPVILSPLAINPIVLCPGVGLVIILSPLVLNPFILTPIVLTPVILSPFALSPFIADPNVLSPLILSPFVLSPLIWSPPAVSAFVLTPYALSPVIQSDGAVFTAVLSPSWLS